MLSSTSNINANSNDSSITDQNPENISVSFTQKQGENLPTISGLSFGEPGLCSTARKTKKNKKVLKVKLTKSETQGIIEAQVNHARRLVTATARVTTNRDLHVKRKIKKLRSCLTNILTQSSLNDLNKQHLEDTMKNLQKRMENDQLMLEDLTANLTNLQASYHEIQDHLGRQTDMLKYFVQMEDRIKSKIATSETREVSQAAQSIYSLASTSTPSSESTREASPPKNEDALEKSKAIYIKAKTKQTGRRVSQLLDSARIVTSAIVTGRVIMKNEVRVECKTTRDADVLREDLHNNPIFNEKLMIFKKLPHLQWTILLGVPEEINEAYLMNSIQSEYIVKKQELLIIKNMTAKVAGTKNWIILMVPTLLQCLIEDRGLLLGASRYPVRPFTQITRCRRCQAFDHVEKYCRNSPFCVNCGKKHNGTNEFVNAKHKELHKLFGI